MTVSRTAPNFVAVNAGVSQPSSTRMLVDRVVAALGTLALGDGPDGVCTHRAVGQTGSTVDVIDLRGLATEIAQGSVSGVLSEAVATAVSTLTNADGVVLATPVYKASYSGLFKSFFDLLPSDALLGVPTLLAATGGSPRHALAVDAEMRPLLAYMRALVTPTSLYASSEDWGTGQEHSLATRIDRAAGELVTLVRSGAGRAMVGADWGTYQRSFTPGDDDSEIHLDPDLLRAARGGSLA